MKYLLFIPTLIIVVCCKTNKVKSTDNADNSISNSEKLIYDTIIIDNQTHYIEIISKSDFDEIDNNASYTSFSEEEIDNPLYVERNSIHLNFKLRNGTILTLTDSSGYFDHMNDYIYLKSLESIDQWLVYEMGMEWGNYLLINKANGTKISTWAEPVFAPDEKSFVCFSYDMEAMNFPNGIQYFKIIDSSPILIWQQTWDDWGPTSIKWENSNSILIERSDSYENYYYNRMVLN
jgi:hypothetical protein